MCVERKRERERERESLAYRTDEVLYASFFWNLHLLESVLLSLSGLVCSIVECS